MPLKGHSRSLNNLLAATLAALSLAALSCPEVGFAAGSRLPQGVCVQVGARSGPCVPLVAALHDAPTSRGGRGREGEEIKGADG
jgi:hypothetical protein